MPINDAEAVIEPFWDPALSDLDCYQFCPRPGTGAHCTQGWCWVELSWQSATPGAAIFRMTRDVDIDLTDYDALRIRCAVPGSARLTLKAVVDGREQTVVDGVIGPDRKWEYTGPVAGKRLERLSIIYDAIKDGQGGGTLQWISLVNRRIEEIRQARACPYSRDWPKFLQPSGHPVKAAPGLGLLFDSDDLIRIRRNVAHPSFRCLMNSLRETARGYLTAQPEQFVMESGATINRHHRAYDIARGVSDPSNLAIVCGFVGLVDDDTDLLRMSARGMLAMAHAQYWDDCFQEHFPGSPFDHRSFTAGDNSYACALGLDWAGAVLTEAGRRLVLDAVSKKGITLINKDFVQWDYIFDCNQAATFSEGRIAGLLAMRSRWPRVDPWIDLAERDLRESLERVFNRTDDHASLEGPSYGGATLLRALRALTMLSRHRGKALSEMVPEAMLASGDYSFMFLSTAGPPGSYIPYGDGHRVFQMDMVSLMARAAPHDSRWENLRCAMIAHQTSSGQDANASVPGLHTLILTDPPGRAGSVDLPVFSLLAATGMLESCRETPAGPVRLQLIGTAAGAGHVHQDKGSFVLEAFGETLALDRGCTNYGHPLCTTLKSAWLHNVLTPAPTVEQWEEQELIAEHAALVTGRGDDRSVDAAIDTTDVWLNRPFKRHSRRIYSPDPTLFFIEDTVEYERPRAAVFHLHTSWPIERERTDFVIHGERTRLLVIPIWNPAEAAFHEDLFDGSGGPVNHLMLTSRAGTAYRLVTVLQVLERGGEKRWQIKADGEESTAIIATRAGECHTFRPA